MPQPTTATPSTAPTPVQPSPATRLPRGLAAFRHRDYRIFWFAQLGSLTGGWMQGLAQSWLVLTMTESALQLGLINVCQFGPTLVFGLPAGVVADRFAKRRLLLVTQAVAGVLAGTLAYLVASGNVALWHIYAVALGLGIVSAFDMPTRQAFVAEVVGKEDLMNAVALNSALFNATRVIGPALAGVLLAQVGAAICFIVNAASYAPVVVALAAMRTRGDPTPAGEKGTGVERLRQGLAYVRATRAVLLPIVLVGVIATFGMNFNVWVPLLARRDFGAGAGAFGLLMSAMGIGSLTGALLLAFKARRPRRSLMLSMAVIFGALEGALAFAAAVPFPFVVSLPLMAGVGFAMSTTMATANTLVQAIVPDELRGRVMSIYTTVFAGTLPIGALLSGATSKVFGTPASVALGGAVVVSVAAVAAAGGGLSRLPWLRRDRATATTSDPADTVPAPPVPAAPGGAPVADGDD